MSHYLKFVDLNYKPGKDDLICLFYFEPAPGMSTKEAIGRIAAESSNGTWSETQLGTLPHIMKIRARAFKIKGNYVHVAYPLDLFELGSIPQLLSSVAGNIFGMKAMKNLRLMDITFPKKYVQSFKGPQFGIEGIRKFMKIYNRPLTATVPKPKVGMTTEEHAKVGYEAWVGGVDLLKDDENLTDQNFNKFDARVKLCAKMRDKAEKETGEKKDYLINVTAETNEMLRRAKLAHDYGFKYIMADIVTTGFAGLQTLRNFTEDTKQAIHAHRAMHATFTRNPKHGLSMLFLAKLARLVGVDNLHIGTVIGKLVGTKDEVLMLEHEIEHQLEPDFKTHEHILCQDWYNLKSVLATSSGGLHPGLIPQIIKMLGKDICVQLGGGIHGHPNGTRIGAKALRQAIEATMKRIPLKEYSKSHKELETALQKWGSERPI
nr:RuBisCO long chain, Form III-b [uncultured archaeon]